MIKIMSIEIREEKRKKKHGNSLKVVEVKHVQVPDAEERLNKVFKILMNTVENMEEK